MPATTADDLLPLTAQVHRAGRRLEQAADAPRVQTLRRLAGFATASMTEAALAYERQAIEPELIARVQDAAEALVFGDRLREVGIDGRAIAAARCPRTGCWRRGRRSWPRTTPSSRPRWTSPPDCARSRTTSSRPGTTCPMRGSSGTCRSSHGPPRSKDCEN